jgi:hypothetical protein
MRAMPRLLTPLALAILLCLATFAVAHAKGGPSALRGATLSGGGLPEPVTTSISIPDQSYELRTLHSPANDLFADPFELFVLYQTAMPYEVILHYDYERWGGEQDKPGVYDGDRLIYFPGPGTWYEASPRLARYLREEIFWGMAPAGVQGVRGGGLDQYTSEILILMTAATLLVVGHRAWQEDNEVASPAEVEARMRNRSQPDALIHF